MVATPTNPLDDRFRQLWFSFSTTYGGLRSLVTRSASLSLVIAARQSAADLNRRTQDFVPCRIPAEITARLLERQREFQSILEHGHELVSHGEGG